LLGIPSREDFPGLRGLPFNGKILIPWFEPCKPASAPASPAGDVQRLLRCGAWWTCGFNFSLEAVANRFSVTTWL